LSRQHLFQTFCPVKSGLRIRSPPPGGIIASNGGQIKHFRYAQVNCRLSARALPEQAEWS